MKAGVIGSGIVAKTLAAGLKKYGYDVMIGSREPGKLKGWADENGVKQGTFEDAAKFGELIVLAVKGTAALNAVELAGVDNLSGKTVIDTTNPIDDSRPPENGVLHFTTSLENSLMEQLQKHAPKANFVKCFNQIGNPFMVNPDFGNEKPTMFICGNSEGAKNEVKEIL